LDARLKQVHQGDAMTKWLKLVPIAAAMVAMLPLVSAGQDRVQQRKRDGSCIQQVDGQQKQGRQIRQRRRDGSCGRVCPNPDQPRQRQQRQAGAK
jgi:hypothetical protein